jgi:pimeloyl-ACP methyl ester carboxylesterase
MTDAKVLLPGFDERSAQVREVRLRWFEAGAGEAVVLVHGWGGNAFNWTLVAPALAETHRVLCVDLPGHGGSSPLAAAPTLAPYADRLAQLLERERVDRAVLVGHSLGALVSVRFAIRHPERTRGLVLCGAAGIESTSSRARLFVASSIALKPGRRIAPFAEKVAASPRLRRLVLGHINACDPEAMSPRAVLGFLAATRLGTDTASAGRAMLGDDPRAELERVRCPALVVWGAEDRQVPLRDAFEYARRLRAPVRVIPGCGHFLIGERPDAVNAAVAELVGRLG